MSFLSKIFGTKDSSASIAKDRLTMMIAYERKSNALPYLNDLKAELLAVIKKYTEVEKLEVRTEQNGDIDLLEVEITLGRDVSKK